MGKGKTWNKKGGGGSVTSNLSAARGFGCVISTCDVNRAQEGSKELLNLLTQTIEVVYPHILNEGSSSRHTEDGKHLSMEDALALEIQKTMNTKVVQSLQTGVKGLICVKICHHDVNPVVLVRHIFDNVRKTGMACARHLCRVVPLEKVFFANEDEFKLHAKLLVKERFGVLDETTDAPLSTTTANSSSEDIEKSTSNDVSLCEAGADPVENEVQHDETQDVDNAEEKGDGISHEKRGAEEISLVSPMSKRLRTSSDDKEKVEGAEHQAILSSEGCGSSSSMLGGGEGGEESVSNSAVSSSLPDGRNGSSDARIAYCVLFKKRNHNILHRTMAQDTVVSMMPSNKFFVNFRQPQVRQYAIPWIARPTHDMVYI